MSDLEIRSGGIVAVDTASLEAAAASLEQAHAELAEVGVLLRGTAAHLASVAHLVDAALVGRAWGLVEGARRRAETPQALAEGLRASAALFEVIELHAQRAAAAAGGDAQVVARIDDRLSAIEAVHPGTLLHASAKEFWRDAAWPATLVGQISGSLSWLGPGAGAVAAAAVWGLTHQLRAMGTGIVPRDAQLHGAAASVRVVQVQGYALFPVTAATAPATLAAAANRIPDGAAQIRVEQYTLRDGSRQFAVYVAGTRSPAAGGSDPFDALSDVELAAGRRSSSFDAVLAALADAGAEPGDVVHAFGHSQGAMINAHLAVEGGFDTRTLVGFGSPVDADVGEGTLSVAVRHSDDPVAALAGGGHSGTVGAPGSFVAERIADPDFGLDEFAAHDIKEYAETAAMLDQSTDPRMATVRSVLAELGGAASVTVTEYRAERVSPFSVGGG